MNPACHLDIPLELIITWWHLIKNLTKNLICHYCKTVQGTFLRPTW